MKKIFAILFCLLPLYIQAQTGCGDSEAINYYCNTDAGNFAINPVTGCQFLGNTDEFGAPIF